MKKQIQKHGLVMEALMLTLGTLGSSMLCADWDEKSLDDEVDWIVDHEQDLTEAQLDEKMAALPREYQEKLVAQLNDKMVDWLMRQSGGGIERRLIKGITALPEEYQEKFVVRLCDEIARLTDNGRRLSDVEVAALMQKIKILPAKYREELYDRLSDEEIEAILIGGFKASPKQYPISAEIWLSFSEKGQRECLEFLRHGNEEYRAKIQPLIMAGDLSVKIRYFGYLSAARQGMIWPALSQTLKALCFKKLKPALRRKFFFDLDKDTQEQYINEGYQPSQVRFQPKFLGY